MTITVLLSLKPPDGTTKYVSQLVEGRAEGTRYRFFSWRTALCGTYDVFHVHWPEYLLRARNPVVRAVKQSLVRLLLWRLKITRTPLVRTVHNLHPHERGAPCEAQLLQRIDALTTLDIRLNSIPSPRSHPAHVIPIGHYRSRYRPPANVDAQDGRLLYFGYIRPYKGVDNLLTAFEKLRDATVRLRIVGQPLDDLGRMVQAACARDSRISAALQFVTDDDLADEVCRASLVVLPFKVHNHNSATILVALSLSRPVLVPRSVVSELLSTEVGPGWVHLYDGELTATVLDQTLRIVRIKAPPAEPHLRNRDWSLIGQRHYEAYRHALEIASRRQSTD